MPFLHLGGIDENPIVFLAALVIATAVVFVLARKPKE
jgi:hypothetical protein